MEHLENIQCRVQICIHWMTAGMREWGDENWTSGGGVSQVH